MESSDFKTYPNFNENSKNKFFKNVTTVKLKEVKLKEFCNNFKSDKISYYKDNKNMIFINNLEPSSDLFSMLKYYKNKNYQLNINCDLNQNEENKKLLEFNKLKQDILKQEIYKKISLEMIEPSSKLGSKEEDITINENLLKLEETKIIYQKLKDDLDQNSDNKNKLLDLFVKEKEIYNFEKRLKYKSLIIKLEDFYKICKTKYKISGLELENDSLFLKNDDILKNKNYEAEEHLLIIEKENELAENLIKNSLIKIIKKTKKELINEMVKKFQKLRINGEYIKKEENKNFDLYKVVNKDGNKTFEKQIKEIFFKDNMLIHIKNIFNKNVFLEGLSNSITENIFEQFDNLYQIYNKYFQNWGINYLNVIWELETNLDVSKIIVQESFEDEEENIIELKKKLKSVVLPHLGYLFFENRLELSTVFFLLLAPIFNDDNHFLEKLKINNKINSNIIKKSDVLKEIIKYKIKNIKNPFIPKNQNITLREKQNISQYFKQKNILEIQKEKLDDTFRYDLEKKYIKIDSQDYVFNEKDQLNFYKCLNIKKKKFNFDNIPLEQRGKLFLHDKIKIKNDKWNIEASLKPLPNNGGGDCFFHTFVNIFKNAGIMNNDAPPVNFDMIGIRNIIKTYLETNLLSDGKLFKEYLGRVYLKNLELINWDEWTVDNILNEKQEFINFIQTNLLTTNQSYNIVINDNADKINISINEINSSSITPTTKTKITKILNTYRRYYFYTSIIDDKYKKRANKFLNFIMTAEFWGGTEDIEILRKKYLTKHNIIVIMPLEHLGLNKTLGFETIKKHIIKDNTEKTILRFTIIKNTNNTHWFNMSDTNGKLLFDINEIGNYLTYYKNVKCDNGTRFCNHLKNDLIINLDDDDKYLKLLKINGLTKHLGLLPYLFHKLKEKDSVYPYISGNFKTDIIDFFHKISILEESELPLDKFIKTLDTPQGTTMPPHTWFDELFAIKDNNIIFNNEDKLKALFNKLIPIPGDYNIPGTLSNKKFEEIQKNEIYVEYFNIVAKNNKTINITLFDDTDKIIYKFPNPVSSSSSTEKIIIYSNFKFKKCSRVVTPVPPVASKEEEPLYPNDNNLKKNIEKFKYNLDIFLENYKNLNYYYRRSKVNNELLFLPILNISKNTPSPASTSTSSPVFYPIYDNFKLMNDPIFFLDYIFTIFENNNIFYGNTLDEFNDLISLTELTGGTLIDLIKPFDLTSLIKINETNLLGGSTKTEVALTTDIELKVKNYELLIFKNPSSIELKKEIDIKNTKFELKSLICKKNDDVYFNVFKYRNNWYKYNLVKNIDKIFTLIETDEIDEFIKIISLYYKKENRKEIDEERLKNIEISLINNNKIAPTLFNLINTEANEEIINNIKNIVYKPYSRKECSSISSLSTRGAAATTTTSSTSAPATTTSATAAPATTTSATAAPAKTSAKTSTTPKLTEFSEVFLKKQQQEFEKDILTDLNLEKKTKHWIWWVFPTQYQKIFEKNKILINITDIEKGKYNNNIDDIRKKLKDRIISVGKKYIIFLVKNEITHFEKWLEILTKIAEKDKTYFNNDADIGRIKEFYLIWMEILKDVENTDLIKFKNIIIKIYNKIVLSQN